MHSQWEFKANSNTGAYFINDLNCKFGARGFAINTLPANKSTGLYNFNFVLKTKKGKVLNEDSATIKLLSLTETSMRWQLLTSSKDIEDAIYINFVKEVIKPQDAS